MIPALESTANSADQYIGSKSNSRPGTNPKSRSATDYVPSGTNSRSRSGADYVSSGSDSGSEIHSRTRSNPRSGTDSGSGSKSENLRDQEGSYSGSEKWVFYMAVLK